MQKIKRGKSRLKAFYRKRNLERLNGYLIILVLYLWGSVFYFAGTTSNIKVEAREYQPPVIIEKVDHSKTEKQQILNYIVEVFGDDAADAITIAKCESGFNPDRIGDEHLMSNNYKTGELIGDSIGIFQVRTGGSDWNRAAANGMSVEAFRVKLKDFKYNIDYAKTIYDRAGDWHDWYNCAVKTGLS